MPYESLFVQIQEAIADKLRADEWFSDLTDPENPVDIIPVITEQKGDIENQIDVAVGKIGICVVILTVTASLGKNQHVPGPYLDDIKVVARVFEDVTVNSLSKHAPATVEIITALVHQLIPEGLKIISCDDPAILLFPDPDGLLAYDATFKTSGAITYPPAEEP